VFVVTAFGFDLNPRRLERYLTSAWDSGSSPVVVVNKSDTAADPVTELLEVEPVTMGVPVHAVSAVTGEGLEELDPYLQPGRTIALLGSSVGKRRRTTSRAIVLATADTSAGGRGRL
jgi:ribosome biogenesis GTPase